MIEATRIAFVAGCVLLSSAAFSQEIKEIQAYRTFGGMRFEMDTLTLTHRQVSQLLSINPEASREFARARKSNTISGLMGFTGAVLVTIPIITAILGGDPEWGLAAGGVILIGGSIPFNHSYQRRAAGAVEIYNTGMPIRGRLYLRGAGLAIKL